MKGLREERSSSSGRPLPPLVNAVGVSPGKAHSSQKKRVSQSSSSLKEVMEHAGRLDVFVDSRGLHDSSALLIGPCHKSASAGSESQLARGGREAFYIAGITFHFR